MTDSKPELPVIPQTRKPSKKDCLGYMKGLRKNLKGFSLAKEGTI